MDAAQSHYATLGVERTADERAIKKAYFALVRKFPPESQPDAFQRIREAYEVLSDVDRRRAYDASNSDFGEYGDESASKLGEARAAMQLEDWPRAVAFLEPLVAERPDLHLAQDLLAICLLNQGEKVRALEVSAALAAARADIWSYRLHHAWALRANDRSKEAEAELRATIALAPNEGEPHGALIDFLIGSEQYDPALAAIAAAHEVFTDLPTRIQLTTRRCRIALDRGRLEELYAAVDALLASVPADAEPDLRRFLSARLAGFAAELFATRRPDDANAVLERCRTLTGASEAEAPFPDHRIDCQLSDLPESSRQLLVAAPATHPSLLFPSRAGLAGWAFVAFAITGMALALAFGTRGRWETGGAIVVALALATGAALTSWSAAAIRRYVTSTGEKATFLTTMFLVELNWDRVAIHPLLALHDLQIVHHSTNGVYTHSMVNLTFHRHKLELSLRGQQRAVDWAQQLDDARRRALELLGAGLMNEREDAAMLPLPVLERLAARPSTSVWLPPARRRWVGVTFAATAAAFALAFGANVLRSGSTTPSPADAARLQLTEAASTCRRRATPVERHDGAALCTLLESLATGGAPRLVVSTTLVGASPALATALQAESEAIAKQALDALGGRGRVGVVASGADLATLSVSLASPHATEAQLTLKTADGRSLLDETVSAPRGPGIDDAAWLRGPLHARLARSLGLLDSDTVAPPRLASSPYAALEDAR